jgi:fatty-acyl-CoA synthase
MALSYTNGAADTPLLGETIGANLERTAERFGEREALVSRHQGLRYTYAEFDAEVDRVARGLLKIGL